MLTSAATVAEQGLLQRLDRPGPPGVPLEWVPDFLRGPRPGHRQERRLNPMPLLARHGDLLLQQLKAGAALHAGSLVGP